ncbi:MAG: dihydroorotate dehydrogenase electron transfer subunit [Clostridiales bacterium]|jgi:dihydroorotate dehydrogenase electron transfer subunit|nr:dihydroorotate dehydrogenase electron transfer subunit [Clostridiales bacterium]
MATKTTYQCEVLVNERLTDTVYRLALAAPELARAAKPGQFAAVRCGGPDAYLRRPLGICDADAAAGSVTLLSQVKGKGTRALTEYVYGHMLDVLGPLGNGFDLSGFERESAGGRAAAVVGGGIGLFPLLLLTKRLRALGFAPDVFLGFRDRQSAVLLEEFKRAAGRLFCASDDGSLGEAGLVTAPFARAQKVGGGESGVVRYRDVFACGPAPMLRAVQRICGEAGTDAQLSLEQRMGCGVGACLVCACAIRDPALARAGQAGPDDFWYKRVCRDGPVFPAKAVVFDEQ